MNEPDFLSHQIHALKELQRVAWRQLADSALTTFERRELRNELKQSETQLRCYLDLMSDRCRSRVRAVEDDAARAANQFEFRLLAGN
jgi:hypothetical protein